MGRAFSQASWSPCASEGRASPAPRVSDAEGLRWDPEHARSSRAAQPFLTRVTRGLTQGREPRGWSHPSCLRRRCWTFASWGAAAAW